MSGLGFKGLGFGVSGLGFKGHEKGSTRVPFRVSVRDTESGLKGIFQGVYDRVL